MEDFKAVVGIVGAEHSDVLVSYIDDHHTTLFPTKSSLRVYVESIV